MYPPLSTHDTVRLYFYKETLYFYAIPNIFCFISSLFLIVYMSYTKYRLSLGVAPQHNIRSSQERGTFPRRLAWQDGSKSSTSANQSVSNQHFSRNVSNKVFTISDNIERRANQELPWHDSTLWTPISTFMENVKKYSKVNIPQFLLLSMLLPSTIMTICINDWDLKFEDWGSFVENLMFLQLFFLSLYPYVIKLKLDKFC